MGIASSSGRSCHSRARVAIWRPFVDPSGLSLVSQPPADCTAALFLVESDAVELDAVYYTGTLIPTGAYQGISWRLRDALEHPSSDSLSSESSFPTPRDEGLLRASLDEVRRHRLRTLCITIQSRKKLMARHGPVPLYGLARPAIAHWLGVIPEHQRVAPLVDGQSRWSDVADDAPAAWQPTIPQGVHRPRPWRTQAQRGGRSLELPPPLIEHENHRELFWISRVISWLLMERDRTLARGEFRRESEPSLLRRLTLDAYDDLITRSTLRI